MYVCYISHSPAGFAPPPIDGGPPIDPDPGPGPAPPPAPGTVELNGLPPIPIPIPIACPCPRLLRDMDVVMPMVGGGRDAKSGSLFSCKVSQ